VADFPVNLRGVVPEGLPYSGWQLLEHLRIALEDILRYTQNEDGGYVEKEWPAAYWPKAAAPASAGAWDASIKGYLKDRAELERLVGDASADLLAPFPWGDGQNLLRQALLAADHAAYHIGELVLVRRLLGAWKR
jgi:DinB superfamily